MSVQFEILDFPSPPPDRRSAPRHRFDVLMPAVLGRGDAVVLDVSPGGARVMHYAAHALDSHVRLVFAYGGRRFSATARVLASRVVGLGNGPRGTTSYESRLQFIGCTSGAAATLELILELIERDRLRVWVSNASGDESQPNDSTGSAGYFMRCRLRGRHWSKCWTRDPSQPTDGFTVAAKLGEKELAMLREAYERADAEGRHLIRATAELAA